MTDLRCRSSERRGEVRAAARLTGIDDVDYFRYADEAGVDPAQPIRPRLRVRLLGYAPPALLNAETFAIEGGHRVRNIRVLEVRQVDDPEDDVVLELTLDVEGDASIYTLRLVGEGDRRHPPLDVDPRYDRAQFSFKLDCPIELDCEDGGTECEPSGSADPALDYLARDYASFRQLLLERMSLVLPSWTERHAADVGITLVELLAYVGDQLTYRQDVVATEAYLETARLRTSVRRHARLVDYPMHEGVNARTWITVCVAEDLDVEAHHVRFCTRVADWPDVIDERNLTQSERYEVFLPMTLGTLRWRKSLGRIRFYTWRGSECSLARGATRATLILSVQLLAPGDVLILEEVRDPVTGRTEYADPARRHAVRLTRAERISDPLAPDLDLCEIEWSGTDALPFPLRLSSLDPRDPNDPCAPRDDISVARGNVVLADHGRWIDGADLGCVEVVEVDPVCEALRRPALRKLESRRYRPALPGRPLTFVAPPPANSASASEMLRQDPRSATPTVTLSAGPALGAAQHPRCPRCGAARSERAADLKPARTEVVCSACQASTLPEQWKPRRDLLASNPDDPHFVVEMDDDEVAHLRFGDGLHGKAPEPWTGFRAWYRLGNGPVGNVPSEAIAHVAVVGTPAGTNGIRVRNPLPATGGTAAEPIDDVRSFAPSSLHARRERAVIAADYGELALRDDPKLQRAAANLRWTGSWYEVAVGLDPWGTAPAGRAHCTVVEGALERYRRIGHELRVSPAAYVPIRLGLDVCAKRDRLRAHIRSAVLDAVVGQRGFFHPDRFTFGTPLRLSALIAAVQVVPGIVDVRVTRMERLFDGDRGELEAGEVRVGWLEIIQLENDPALPEHGQIDLVVRGGR